MVENNVNDLMVAYDWKIDNQYYLDIPNTEMYLSVIPEYNYLGRKPDGKMFISREPVSVKLNCALLVKSPMNSDIYDISEHVEFNCEEDFYAYMIKMSKNSSADLSKI